jgi:thioredoxin 1
MSELATPVGDADFDTEVLQSGVPVLVDFWATWCAPCKAMAPMLDELARDYAGRVKMVKVDIDSNQKTAIACHVRSAPTLLLFKDGAVQATQIGAVPKSQLARMLDAAL